MNSAPGRTRSISPMPWPEPPKSRQALPLAHPSESNFIAGRAVSWLRAKGHLGAGVPPRPAGDGDDPVRAFLDGFAREAVVDHVMERDPAPAVHGLVEFDAGTERADHDRHLPLGADVHIVIEP